MTTNNPEKASENAILQQAIDILKQTGGKATAKELYDRFGTVLGHTVDETEANNIYQIVTASSAASCLIQPDGKCLYISTANDQTFILEDNSEEKGVYHADTTGMEAALSKANNPQGYVPDGSHESDAVVEPDQLIKDDSAAARDQQQIKDTVRDVKADAQAEIDAAKAAVTPDHEDREIDRLSRRLKADEKKIETEKERIEKHEEQIAHDKTKLMKDFHEAEIHHDEKVIDREQARAHKLEDEIAGK